MAKKANAEPAKPAITAAAKPVIAVEYNGALYPSFQSAEAARAKAELLSLLVPSRAVGSYDYYGCFIDSGRRNAVDDALANAERVHAILTKYLAAANIEMPTNVAGSDA